MRGVVVHERVLQHKQGTSQLFQHQQYPGGTYSSDVIIMFGSLILIFLDNTVGVNIGGFLRALTYWTFILGLLMTYASLKERPLYIGLFGYGGDTPDKFYEIIVRRRIFQLSWLFGFAVYAGLGYLVLRKVPAGAAARTR